GFARITIGTHGPCGAVGVAVGHLVGHHLRGLRGGGRGVALALGAVHHLPADMVAVDAVAYHAAGYGAADGRQLLAVAAADLVADQAADDRAGHGAADVAVALGHPLGHDHVVADFARRGGGAGLAHRFGLEHLGVQFLLLGDRLDVEHGGVLEAAGP